MGRSLRRLKKQRPKIIRRKHKKKFAKSKLPQEIRINGAADVGDKLGVEIDWDDSKHLKDNYDSLGFIMDPNEGHGRKKEQGINLEQETKNDDELDDDLRRTMGMVSHKGKSLPKRPTDRQRRIVQQLRQVHGDDVQAMARDHKRNKMQISAAKLQSMIESCDYWPEKSGVDFRVPVKGLWRS